MSPRCRRGLAEGFGGVGESRCRSKAAVIRGLQNDAIYLKSSSIRQLHFLGLICQVEAAVKTLSAFEGERVL